MPKIKPRLYSISSSPLLHPQQIQIAVGVLQVKTDAGKTRQGLCSKQVWAYLSHPKCHYYVCGDAKMADDVFDVLMAIAKNQGGLSHIEAVDFFDKMKQENRFNTDVWGVTLNFKKAIKQLQKDNYSKAEKWLDRVSDNSTVEIS